VQKKCLMSRAAALLLTADRRRSTGESHQALCSLLPQLGRPLSIPAARCPEQAQLEAAVFQRVCAMGGLSEHPLGIVRVRPQEDRLTLQLVDEPYVIACWVDLLRPAVDEDMTEDPRDRVSGVPGLRSCREAGGIRLYRPGTAAFIGLTGFNPRWWERIAGRRRDGTGSLLHRTGWTAVEQSAYTAQAACPRDASALLSPLLRRIRATAGFGPVNSTDVWTTGEGVRLETTDGPPCASRVNAESPPVC